MSCVRDELCERMCVKGVGERSVGDELCVRCVRDELFEMGCVS